MLVVDAHSHIFPPAFRERREEILRRDATFGELYANPRATLASAPELVAAMDAAGVDAAVAVGIGWQDPEVAREANDYLMESAARYPGRIVGFCGVNPAWGHAAAAEIERCARGGLRGVGELHPDTQGFRLDDPSLLAATMEVAERLGLPVLVHSSEPVGHLYAGKGRTTPEVLLRFIQHFPRNTVICAHWGGGLPFYALMPEVKEALARTYFDSAASPFLYDGRVFALAASLLGPERLLFATDYPLLRPQRVLAQVRESGLDAEAQAMLLGGNTARLLGLDRR